ncbi:MAG: hypothetical protein DYG88_02250 [Chloroflexi bacterium CFX4]|nr:hypothetical protein [Chloroflexi bacterium CFX4]MDL1922475.1 hypothetical protein [Chloroflexi bacterium CFX3]
MSLIAHLAHIGVVQFGQFATPKGSFVPFRLDWRLLPSYPPLLAALTAELLPLAKQASMSHLLPMPAALPLGTALSLQAEMPLVFVAPDDPEHVEGAYDYNVPTLLLTDNLTDGAAESALIRRVRRHGLHVEAVLAVLDWQIGALLPEGVTLCAWQPLEAFITASAAVNGTPAIHAAAQAWIAEQHRAALARED